MSKFAEHVDLNKVGIIQLDEVGAYSVFANRELYEQGRAGRFAVANTKEQWVDSVHYDRDHALSTTQKLSAT
ncbi:MAG: hypothetical protein BMS9Abin28_2374 [Anaerolineae bacterium]|nr:MAG: hypothetical protein BMS9Abin28_2374 [Anaerolineae bacterium]